MMKRKDPLTGEWFEQGRSNQIFANKANQIKYNNLRAAKRRKRDNLNLSNLKRNVKILDRIFDKTDNVYSEEYLKGAGFDFNASNGIHRIDGIIYQCVYEYLITIFGEDFEIIKNHGENS